MRPAGVAGRKGVERTDPGLGSGGGDLKRANRPREIAMNSIASTGTNHPLSARPRPTYKFAIHGQPSQRLLITDENGEIVELDPSEFADYPDRDAFVDEDEGYDRDRDTRTDTPSDDVEV